MIKNQIEEVKHIKNKYFIKINNEEIFIDDFYYKCLLPYAGKILDNKTYNEMICFHQAFFALSNLYKKIYRNSISKRELYFALKNNGLDSFQIKIIINRLIEEGYLDELSYVNYYKEQFEFNKGINAFINFLEENKINSDLIEQAKCEYNENYDYALSYANSYIKSKCNSQKMAIIKIKSFLISKGFSNELIEEVLENINDIDEEKSLLKDYNKYKKMYNDKSKILTKLLQKGYNIDIIKKVMECDDYEN